MHYSKGIFSNMSVKCFYHVWTESDDLGDKEIQKWEQEKESVSV